MGVYLSSPVTEKVSEEDENTCFQYGISAMQGWRVSMEDAHLAILNFDGHSDRALFGIFDGHSGSSVAKFCAKYFPALLLDSAEYKAGDYKAAMHSIYLEIDQMLQRPEHFEELREMSKKPQSGDNEQEGELSPLQLAQQGMLPKPEQQQYPNGGCTAVLTLVDGKNVYVANAGDSRCVLSLGGQTKAMTEDHKPENPEEKERIQKAGGFVADNRVNGNLAMSRAIGDLYLKQGEGPANEQLVVATPEIRHAELNDEASFLILACDGIWDMLTNEEAVKIVEKQALQGKTPKEICESLCDQCLAPSTNSISAPGKGCDNMSVIVVFLQSQIAALAADKALQSTSVANTNSGAAPLATAQVPGTDISSAATLDNSMAPAPEQSHAAPTAGAVAQMSLPHRCAAKHVSSKPLRHVAAATAAPKLSVSML